MSTLDNVNSVLTQMQAQLKQVKQGLATARLQVADLKPEVAGALKVLFEEYKHPQGVAAVLQSYGQAERFVDMERDLSTAVAALQIAVLDTDAVETQIKANEETIESPLPSAGGGSESDPNGQAAPAPAAAQSAQAAA